MPKPKLVVFETSDRYCYQIGWFLPDEGEIGGILGEGVEPTKASVLKAKDRGDREHEAAGLAASQTSGVRWIHAGYFWGSRADANKALRAVKAALTNLDDPWPEWAIKARAEGWKPPKNWKP